MPGINGGEFIKLINKNFPNTKTFMLTGKTDFNKSLELINSLDLNKFFNKPYDTDELINAIKSL